MTVKEAMRLIQELDPEAKIDFSTWSDKWYVTSRVYIGDGAVISSPTEHRETPQDAVYAYIEKLTNLRENEFLITHQPDRKEWRWEDGKWSISNIGREMRIERKRQDVGWAQKRVDSAVNDLNEAQQSLQELIDAR